MLDAHSPFLTHAAQDIFLILVSLAFLPFTTFVVFWSYVATRLYPGRVIQRRRRIRSAATPDFEPKTVLVTGVGMTKGLCLARLFYAAGHDVIGADFEPALLPTSCGRKSRALKAFYKLPQVSGLTEAQVKFTLTILDIIRKEKVHIWVPCSDGASEIENSMAKEMVELLTRCRVVQFNVETTERLHDQHSFIDYTKMIGLPVLEMHTVTSKAAALQVLLDEAANTDNQYILQDMDTDESVRRGATLLPLSSPTLTKAYISSLQMSEARPRTLQQYIRGSEYYTHSLVVKGEVKAFVACPSSEQPMYCMALPSGSALSRAMLRFTQEFALAGGPSFTGHLSFDFLVERDEAKRAERDPTANIKLYPLECKPSARTAACLFHETPDIVDGYLSLIEPKPALKVPAKKSLTPNGLAQDPIFPVTPAKFHWIGHDFVKLVLLPVLSLFSPEGSQFFEVFERFVVFLDHALSWKDGTFEFWDPVPAWWLYHIYWPTQFLTALLTGQKWSRVNVSTCQMLTRS